MPSNVHNGFVNADSGNLPKISMFIVLEYFTFNSKFATPEIYGVEATL